MDVYKVNVVVIKQLYKKYNYQRKILLVRMTKIYLVVTIWCCAVFDATSMARRLDMPLDVNKLESLGNTDTLMKSLKDIAQKSHNCGVKEIPKLRRHYLRNSTVTCNDGSRAG